MSEPMHVPEAFSHLVEMANEGLGGFAMWATDEFFADKEMMLHRHEAVWIADRYTDKGKWMDGWESMRRRTPGHDVCIVRLGLAGEIHGVVVDTSHFTGNAPSEAELEGIEAPGATIAQLQASEAWFPVLARSALRANARNVFEVGERRRVTHVRLRIHPDGGVARLRVFGRVIPEARTFRRPGTVDLVSIENGGTIVKVSNRFYGPPANLLLPGRGVNMGDGWETARRRTPGSDWAVVKLGRPGRVDRIEFDTHFFKGNAPQQVLVEAIDARSITEEALEAFCSTGAGGAVLVSRTPTEPHKRHQLEPDRRMVVTHVRVHIFPHGGVNRMRVYGEPVDSVRDSAKRDQLNAMAPDAAEQLLRSFNGSTRWVKAMLARRPFGSVRALFEAADECWWASAETDFLEAFAAHPRIGEKKAAASQTAQSATWSAGEQAGVDRAQAEVLARLASQNEAYFKKFGFIYICFATGRSADEMLALLDERIGRSRAEEIATAAAEQSKIKRHRIDKWLDA